MYENFEKNNFCEGEAWDLNTLIDLDPIHNLEKKRIVACRIQDCLCKVPHIAQERPKYHTMIEILRRPLI